MLVKVSETTYQNSDRVEHQTPVDVGLELWLPFPLGEVSAGTLS